MSETDFLKTFGWNEFFDQQPRDPSLMRARVIGEEKGLYRAQVSLDRVVLSSISGKMQFGAATRADYPAVGDWILLSIPATSDRGLVQEVCKRQTVLQRKQAGGSGETQILSTNVDFVLVACSLNEDLNLRRIERYLAVVHEAGAKPVILLTKADLGGEGLSETMAAVEKEFPGVAVHAISKTTFATADVWTQYFTIGTTSVILGSSGVGKSTLVNFLIGREVAKTQDIREGDSKGRHTTTSRSLFVSRFGGLIIDTPGMREIQIADHEHGISTQFADIDQLVTECRFTDCQHKTEPNCAVKVALATGDLSEDRWKSYLKLLGEVRHEQQKQAAKPSKKPNKK